MNTLQEWADYYLKMGIYTFPSNQEFNWNDWRNLPEAQKTYQSVYWSKASGMVGVAGIKGIRILHIKSIKGRDNIYKQQLVQKILDLLELQRYPWVFYPSDSISILVETPDDQGNKQSDKEENIELLWQDKFYIPYKDSMTSCYYNALPLIKPAHISSELLISCFNILKERLCL